MKYFNPKQIIKVISIFVISYFLFTLLWIQVKDSYGHTIIFLSSKITAVIKNSYLENIIEDKNIIHTYFSKSFEKRRIIFTISVPTYIYTSNMPMTIAIIISLYPFVKKKIRAYSEALGVLLFMHLFYGVSFTSLRLTTAFMSKGIDPVNPLKVTCYQFLWGFSDYIFIRFGAFLIGLYIYLRFKDANT